jgi:uncharacterized membrane protein
MLRKLGYGTLVATIAFMWGVAIALRPGLPERIPLHFTIDGTPDKWGAPTVGNWFMIPILGSSFALLFLGLALALPAIASRYPSIVNIPRKAEFLALPTEARRRVMGTVGTMLSLISSAMLLMFTHILYATAQVALGECERAPVLITLAPVALILAIVVVGQIRIRQRIAIEAAISRAGIVPE